MDLDLLFKLEKLDLNGTPENKDIVVLQFLQEGSPEQVMSLQKTIQHLAQDANWKHVTFLMLPSHMRLSTLSEEDLDSIGLVRK